MTVSFRHKSRVLAVLIASLNCAGDLHAATPLAEAMVQCNAYVDGAPETFCRPGGGYVYTNQPGEIVQQAPNVTVSTPTGAYGNLITQNSASAKWGVLRAKSDTRASTISTMGVSAIGEAVSQFRDYETVIGSGPIGTPVSFQYEYDIFVAAFTTASITTYPGAPTPEIQYQYAHAAAYLAINNQWVGCAAWASSASIPGCQLLPLDVAHYTIRGIIDSTIGAEIEVFATLNVGSGISAYNPSDGILPTVMTFASSVDAGNSAYLFLTPITPGAGLISASGHDYSISAVPETQTPVMLGFGLCIIVLRLSTRRHLKGITSQLRQRADGGNAGA